MADKEVKASPSLGATEPPSPSPSAAPANPLPDALQPLPATSSAYRAIANLNRGFELDRRNLSDLQEFNFFPEDELIAWGNILGRLQAEASLCLLEILRDRLINNALYYDRLCSVKQREPEDPNGVLIKADVLPEAEQRQQEAAAGQEAPRTTIAGG